MWFVVCWEKIRWRVGYTFGVINIAGDITNYENPDRALRLDQGFHFFTGRSWLSTDYKLDLGVAHFLNKGGHVVISPSDLLQQT